MIFFYIFFHAVYAWNPRFKVFMEMLSPEWESMCKSYCKNRSMYIEKNRTPYFMFLVQKQYNMSVKCWVKWKKSTDQVYSLSKYLLPSAQRLLLESIESINHRRKMFRCWNRCWSWRLKYKRCHSGESGNVFFQSQKQCPQSPRIMSDQNV